LTSPAKIIVVKQPGPAERWSEALLAADGAYATLAMVLEELEAELDRQHSRDTAADAYRDPDPFDEASPDDEDQEEGTHHD
jgi:hypothetical protein